MNAQRLILVLGGILIVVGLVMTTVQFSITIDLLKSKAENITSESEINLEKFFPGRVGGGSAGIDGTDFNVETTYPGILIIVLGSILVGAGYLSDKPWSRDEKTIHLINGDVEIEIITTGINKAEEVAGVLKEVSQLTPNENHTITLKKGNVEVTTTGPNDITKVSAIMKEISQLDSNDQS